MLGDRERGAADKLTAEVDEQHLDAESTEQNSKVDPVVKHALEYIKVPFVDLPRVDHLAQCHQNKCMENDRIMNTLFCRSAGFVKEGQIGIIAVTLGAWEE